jgi:hypothetical protein
MNSFIAKLRQDYPGDTRTDEDLLFEFGNYAREKRPDWFEQYPDFKQEYTALVKNFRPSLLKEFTGSLGSAVDTTQASLLGAGALASDAVGLDSARDYFKRAAQEQMRQAAEYQPSVGNFSDIEDASDLGRYLTYGAGQVAPSAAMALASGGIGGAVGGAMARGAAATAARGFVGEAAQLAANAALRRGAYIGAQAGLAATTMPQSMGEIYNDTGDVGLSVGFGALQGALDMIPEGYVAGKFFQNAAKEGVKREAVQGARSFAKEFAKTVAKEAAITMPGEGATEAAQEFLGIVAKKLHRGEDPYSISKEDYNQMLNAGFIGAIGGAALSPVAAGGEMRHQRQVREFDERKAAEAQAAERAQQEATAQAQAQARAEQQASEMQMSEDYTPSPHVETALGKVRGVLNSDLGIGEAVDTSGVSTPVDAIFQRNRIQQNIAATRNYDPNQPIVERQGDYRAALTPQDIGNYYKKQVKGVYPVVGTEPPVGLNETTDTASYSPESAFAQQLPQTTQNAAAMAAAMVGGDAQAQTEVSEVASRVAEVAQNNATTESIGNGVLGGGLSDSRRIIEINSLPDSADAAKTIWYHGTGSELSREKINTVDSNISGLMGSGFYMTDDPTLAETYAVKRGKKTGKTNTYAIRVNPKSVLNLEKPITSEVSDIFEKSVYRQFITVVEAALQNGDSTAKLFKDLREAASEESSAEMVPIYEYNEMYAMLENNFRAYGIDALTHIGGLRAGKGKRQHRVLILLDPSSEWTGNGEKRSNPIVDVKPIGEIAELSAQLPAETSPTFKWRELAITPANQDTTAGYGVQPSLHPVDLDTVVAKHREASENVDRFSRLLKCLKVAAK